ncbi:hypothetical protein QQ008_08075 [Fulvivirgaceae bacterium BMA10]|uniref:DUF4625 domain-containing protein n=1 Tax=Splendidivirga corallicola TaxID=3051826 RepID=A0ABT8KM58_9BACT|nr:hypothetical protein [Fulvivirgaceae bacterium BMA10]
MKKIFVFIITLLLMAGASQVQAQQFDPPKSGAVLRLETYQYELKPGHDISTDLWLVRSKRNKKTKFGDFQAKAPTGITVKIDAKENQDVYSMYVTAEQNVEPGNYSIILSAKGKNAHQVKSVVISLKVNKS